jgi:cyclin A
MEVVDDKKPVVHLQIDTFENYSTNVEYSSQISTHLRETQMRFRPDGNYMVTVQREVNVSMRNILMDWLAEVCLEYKLENETLYLAVNLVDRFLSNYSSSKTKLQLIGITCMFLSAKYFELVTPNIDDYVYITDNSYSKEQIIQTELLVLNTLQWNLSAVLIPDLLSRNLIAIKSDSTTANLANYLCELSLHSYEMVQFSPSISSTSAVVIALYALGLPHWNGNLAHYSGHRPSDLEPCIKILYGLYKNIGTATCYTTTREKYSTISFGRVSTIRPPTKEPILS